MIESDPEHLPFVGRKTTLTAESGDRVEVVIHSNGTRDLAFFPPEAVDPCYVARLDSGTACALGGLLCAAFGHPPPA